MLESFRKQPFLIPTGVGTAFRCVMWAAAEEAWHCVGAGVAGVAWSSILQT